MQQILVTNVCPSPHFWCVIVWACTDEWLQLPWSTANEDLVELFETTGHVQQAEILYDGSRSKGMGIVQFEQIDEAETAIGASSPHPHPLRFPPTSVYLSAAYRCIMCCSQVHELHVRRSAPWRTVQPNVAQLQSQRCEGWFCVNSINKPTNRLKNLLRSPSCYIEPVRLKIQYHCEMPPVPHPSIIPRIYACSFLFALSQLWSTNCDLQNYPQSTSSTCHVLPTCKKYSVISHRLLILQLTLRVRMRELWMVMLGYKDTKCATREKE